MSRKVEDNRFESLAAYGGGVTAGPSHSQIEDRIRQGLAGVDPEAAREFLIRQLASLTTDLSQLRATQQSLLAAVRTRDVMAATVPPALAAMTSELIELTPRDSLNPANGVHALEWDRDIAFRWTGPGHELRVQAWLDRRLPVVFELALLSYGDPRNEGALALSVDGVPLPLASAGDKLLRSAPLPLLGGSAFTEVVVRVPYLTSETVVAKPSRRKAPQPAKADDPRVRGIAFTRLRFTACP